MLGIFLFLFFFFVGVFLILVLEEVHMNTIQNSKINVIDHLLSMKTFSNQ